MNVIDDDLRQRQICIVCGEEATIWLCSTCSTKKNADMVETRITIGNELGEKYDKLYSGMLLQVDKAKVFGHGSKLYIITGGCFGPAGSGKAIHDAREVVPAENYDGPKLNSTQLDMINGTGGPFHTDNHLFSCKGKDYVVLPGIVTKFVVYITPQVEQSSMF